MTFSFTSLPILNGSAVPEGLYAYTDGTNVATAHAVLDDTGALVSPSTAALQGAANTSLAQIVTAVQGATPAGANIIGNIRIDQTTPGTTNGVQVNAALPAGSNVIGSVTISALATTIGKVSIDQTSSATNGIYVTSGVALPSPIPVKFIGSNLVRLANTTTYAAGQIIFSTTSVGQVITQTCQAGKASDQAFTVLRCRLFKTNSATTNAIFRIHLYNSQPTLVSGDGSTFISTKSGWMGSLDVTTAQAFSDGAAGIGYPTIGSTIADIPVSGQNYVYYAIEARAAYGPASGEIFTPMLEVQ